MRSSRRINMFRTLLAAFVASYGLTVVENASAGIANGDFGTGDLTGWSTSAIDSNFTPVSADPFIDVTPFGSGAAATFTTGEFSDGLFLASLAQDVSISSAQASLTFDFSLPVIAADTTGIDGGSPVDDALFALLDGPMGIHDLLLVDSLGPVPDPFGSAPGEVILGPPSDPAFDYSIRADLSALAGGTATLVFDLTQEDDGKQIVALAIGNVALVPEPTAGTLLIVAVSVWCCCAGVPYQKIVNSKN